MTDNLPARRADIVANKNLVQLTMEEMYRFAQGYSRAGVIQGKSYKETATVDDLFVRISAGQAIGLDPYTSVSEMYFVKGKLSMSTNLQLGLARASGKYTWKVEWGDSLQDVGVTKEEINAAGVTTAIAASWPNPKWCRFTVYDAHTKEEIGTSLWTMLDSYRAGLLEPSRNGEPSNHLKYPRAMMFNRAGSSAVAYFMPDATMVRMYDVGEVEGDVWDHTPPTVTATVDREEETIEDADIVSETSSESLAREEFAASEEAQQSGVDPVAGEVLPGESSHEAMERMVREEALEPEDVGFDPATEPAPPVVEPPAAAWDDSSPQPTVETSEAEPLINAGRKGLLWVLVKRAQLTDSRRHDIWTEITGQPHMERTPDRFFQALLDRLNAEVEIVESDAEEATGDDDD